MLTNEDLQAIAGLIADSEGRMMARMDKMEGRLDKIEERLSAVEENTEITRGAVNALVEWAEQVAVITKAPFPVQHHAGMEP